ncbi:MAG: hypothetical protein AB7F43_15155 [Bacteriovoracia bacterium]
MIKLSSAYIIGENQVELGVLQTLLAGYSSALSFEITDNNDPQADTFLYKLLVTVSNVEETPDMISFMEFLSQKIIDVNQQLS